MKKINIAIDGPAGSGKTSSAKQVAKMLGYIYIDTGAMYRSVALHWLRTKMPLGEAFLEKLMPEINIEMKYNDNELRVFLNGEDISDEIRSPEISRYASSVSAFACVREKLVEQQRNLAKNGGAVVDGRDIGTVVLPNAELKIFLTASVEERAKRRRKELLEKNIEISLDELIKQIEERDYNDSNREHSPLKKAHDAIEIDTSSLSFESQTSLILQLANDRIAIHIKQQNTN